MHQPIPRGRRQPAQQPEQPSIEAWRPDCHWSADGGRHVDAVLDRWVAEEKIVGVVAMIAIDGELAYCRAAGSADREAGIPVTTDTIFRLASLTKTIVSAAALALVDEGRLSLDHTVRKWLPGFAPRLADGGCPDITVRHLMTHTSGLSYAFFEPEDDAYRQAGVLNGLELSELTLGESMARLASVPLFYAPGTQWRYSPSTDVLGAVIEKAAGLPLPQAVCRYVTGPLGMRDTGFLAGGREQVAAAYRDGGTRAMRMDDDGDVIPLGGGVVVSPARAFDSRAYPSGGAGMCGTARDYIRFLEAMRTGGAPVLGRSAARALATHCIGDLRAWTEGEGWGFSLGAAVLLDPMAAGTPQNPGTWQWAGALGSHWFVDPAAGVTAVVLTNTAVAGAIGAFPAEVRDAIYGRLEG